MKKFLVLPVFLFIAACVPNKPTDVIYDCSKLSLEKHKIMSEQVKACWSNGSTGCVRVSKSQFCLPVLRKNLNNTGTETSIDVIEQSIKAEEPTTEPEITELPME